MPQPEFDVLWSGDRERQGACRSLLGLEHETLRPAPKLARAPHLGGRLQPLTAADQLLLDGDDDE